MKEFDWTPEKTSMLVTMFNAGIAYPKIATAVGCPSRSSVCGKILRLRQQGLITTPARAPGGTRSVKPFETRQTPAVAQLPRIRALYSEGRNDREIADEVGISPDHVRYFRKKEGLGSNFIVQEPPLSRELAEKIPPLVAAGRSDREIGEILGVTRDQVRHSRRKMGVKPPAPVVRPHSAPANIVKGDPGHKVMRVFSEGFQGQRSRIDITGLTDGVCHFPIDQPEGGVRFCGADADDGRPYCSHHAARCYTGAAPATNPKPMHVYTARR